MIIAFVVALTGACKTTVGIKQRPAWVYNRPVSEAYYVGVGIAPKAQVSQYQQAAKKEAMQDLISEIRVTVNSNSALSQFQNNTEFRQQFESDIKITALNTIENFEVVDSWEDAQYCWVYVRLSKAEYQELRRKRMLMAIERAEDYFARAAQFDIRKNYMQALRMKVRALSSLQDYLNEDVQALYNGKSVYLVNEIISSIQEQLYQVNFNSAVNVLNGKVGKPIYTPFDVTAYLTDSSGMIPVTYMPVKMKVEQGKMEFGNTTETDYKGIASFSIARILSKDPVQLIRISTDIRQVMKTDSISQSLQNLLSSVDVPGIAIRVNVEPVKIFIESSEQNLSQQMTSAQLETTLKKGLAEAGCNFVHDRRDADYILRMNANTKALGAIWGNMQSCALDMSITLTDCRNDAEIFKDALQNIKGFQTTPENAGLDAYRTTAEQMMKRIFPQLKKELLNMN